MKEKYTGAKIVSLFVPLVGFIIYGVNIGKNDRLAKEVIKYTFASIVL